MPYFIYKVEDLKKIEEHSVIRDRFGYRWMRTVQRDFHGSILSTSWLGLDTLGNELEDTRIHTRFVGPQPGQSASDFFSERIPIEVLTAPLPPVEQPTPYFNNDN